MLKINDQKFFCELVADAVVQTHLAYRRRGRASSSLRDRRINAIAKAAARILEGDTDFLHWDPEKEILYFWSADSNEIYEIGENSCACPAFRRKKPLPCYHRAMRGLVKNYFDFLRRPGETPKIDFADAVFFDPELSVREKVNLLNLSILEGRIELKRRVTALERFVSS